MVTEWKRIILVHVISKTKIFQIEGKLMTYFSFGGIMFFRVIFIHSTPSMINTGNMSKS